MLHPNTISEIQHNSNTAIANEIALFYCLLNNEEEKKKVMEAISSRPNKEEVKSIITYTNIQPILDELTKRGLSLRDCSFETQNDAVGPSDVVMYVRDKSGQEFRLGLSVKKENECSKNPSGKNFLTDEIIAALKSQYPAYLEKYKQQMRAKYGSAANWHRKTCPAVDEYIGLIRAQVISHWTQLPNKKHVLDKMYNTDSPIDYWIVKYVGNGYELNTSPRYIKKDDINRVELRPDASCFVGFYLENKRIAHMQVKHNNGFLELNFNHKGEQKRKTPLCIIDGIEFIAGDFFGSWNFNVDK